MAEIGAIVIVIVGLIFCFLGLYWFLNGWGILAGAVSFGGLVGIVVGLRGVNDS